MKIPVEIAEEFVVPSHAEVAFALLSDVPRSVRHFPDMHQLVDLGDGVYRWELKPLGAAGISHQVVYASRYVADARARTVRWTPIKGTGNGVIEGRWHIREQGQGAAIAFETRGELEVPVPLLLRAAAKPVVQGLFRQQVQGYLNNLQRSLSA